MTLEQVLAKNITNGRFFAIAATTEKKAKGITYHKHALVTAQFGVNYEHLAEVKAMGERESSRPAWFEHTEYASIVRSKKDASKLYLQIMHPTDCRISYTLADGTPISREELIALGAIKADEERPLTLVYALESIVSINYKEAQAA